MSGNTSRKGRKAGVYSRYLKAKARKKLSSGKQVMSYISKINELRAELELLTSFSSDVIYRLRYDTMKYDYVSPSVVRLLGYTPDEMKELNIRAIIRETRIVTEGMRRVNDFSSLEEQREQGEVNKWQADYLVQAKDGRQLWISDISYPWFDKKGNVIGSVGSLRDISERIAAEEQVKAELTRLANTDPLTNVANRRVFFERVDEEIKRNRRNRRSLSILLLDIDHFKKVNDTYGHDFGDHVLKQTTQVIQTCLRETDMLARLGGEEFGILLPDTPADGAFWVAERIRTAMARHNFSLDMQKEVHCTVSIGVADAISDEAEDATRIYKIADTRLYIAKNMGRNQVSMDEIVALH